MNYYEKEKDKRSKSYEELIFNEPPREDYNIENVNISFKEGLILVYTAFKVFLPQLLMILIPLILIMVLLWIYYPYQDEELLMQGIKYIFYH